MRAVFIRHGQSTGNAGIACHDLALLELTEKGWDQARAVAQGWVERPTLIVTSPYLRTQQTAAPTIARFPDVPVEAWPIQEFTYLEPSRWNGTSSEDRLPYLMRYWQSAEPGYQDGDGAESFELLLRRAGEALERLRTLPNASIAYVFTHGQFIQAVRSLVCEKDLSAKERMQRFWRPGEPPAIANCQRINLSLHAGLWTESRFSNDE